MKGGNARLINLLMTNGKVHLHYVPIQEKVQMCKFLARSYIAQGKEAHGKASGLLEFQPYITSK